MEWIHTTERPHKVDECDENDAFGKNEKFNEISWNLSTKLYEWIHMSGFVGPHKVEECGVNYELNEMINVTNLR